MEDEEDYRVYFKDDCKDYFEDYEYEKFLGRVEYDAILESMVYKLDISDDEKAIVLDKSDAVFKGYTRMKNTCDSITDNIDAMHVEITKHLEFIDDDVYKDIRDDLKDYAKDSLKSSIRYLERAIRFAKKSLDRLDALDSVKK